MLAALTVGISIRIVGILLIAALMVLPVIAAQRRRMEPSLDARRCQRLIGLGAVLAGLSVSYYADLPPGGTIVLVAAGTAVAASSRAVCRGAAETAVQERRPPA